MPWLHYIVEITKGMEVLMVRRWTMVLRRKVFRSRRSEKYLAVLRTEESIEYFSIQLLIVIKPASPTLLSPPHRADEEIGGGEITLHLTFIRDQRSAISYRAFHISQVMRCWSLFLLANSNSYKC
jgi:hypothetical protein